MSYEEAAPNVSQLKTEAQFMVDFPEPPEPSSGPGAPNAAKKAELYDAYLAEYTASGGAVQLVLLAKQVGVPRRWAEILDAEVRAAIAELYAPAEE